MPGSGWTDEAVRTGSADTLGRLPYARRAAELIHSTYSPNSSAVFGLSGPWGSGKTSLVNMIVEELGKTHPEWAVARFTPWATSDISGLLAEFYSSLAEALPKRKSRRVRRALAATAAVAAPAAKLIPLMGELAAEGVRAAGAALAKSPSWQTAFEKASDELKALKKPILVVVDDIDRLQTDELMALLKVVRLLGRFEGVQYLLAYDDETLFRNITPSEQDGFAERFMEKIVQYPLFVPPLLRHQQLSRLNAGLASVSRGIQDNLAPQSRLSGLVECFLTLLTTPRAIDRYIAQLRHHIPLLRPEEVDDEDVQLLTLIRVCLPNLFNIIPRYRNELTSGHTEEIAFENQDLKYRPFDIGPLIDVVPCDAQEVARRLLVSLFPKVQTEARITKYMSYRRQSVQHDEYFDRYFAMGILDHDVSDVTVAMAVNRAIDGDPEMLSELVLGATESVRGLVLSKGISSTSQPSTDTGRIQLAKILATISGSLPAEDNRPFTDQDQLLIWFADLIAALDQGTPSATTIAALDQFGDMALRIRAWARVENKVEHSYRADLPAWYGATVNHLVKQAAADFLHHLKQGDSAATKAGCGYQVRFVLRHDPERLRADIHELLQSGKLNISHLASRLVGVRGARGIKPDWQLSPEFDQELFNELAPPGDDPWYNEAVQVVDVRDLSWSNRRKFAAGRVNPPPAMQ